MFSVLTPRDEDLYDIKYSLEVTGGSSAPLCGGNALIYFIMEYFLSASRKNQETRAEVTEKKRRKPTTFGFWHIMRSLNSLHTEVLKKIKQCTKAQRIIMTGS